MKPPKRVKPAPSIGAKPYKPTRFGTAEGYEVVGEFVEIETGKGADAIEHRPQLAAAPAEARRHRKSAVAVSKLDRLSRDVHFISGLMAQARASKPKKPSPKVERREMLLPIVGGKADVEAKPAKVSASRRKAG